MLSVQLLISTFLATTVAATNGFLHPVIMIPGDGGSRIEARLNKTRGPSSVCYWTSDWFELWLNLYYFLPKTFDCLVDNMRLRSACFC